MSYIVTYSDYTTVSMLHIVALVWL